MGQPDADGAEPGVAPRLTYQPALDGLRGVAVLWVLLYHGAVRWARGGFLGVDVFFVLSGYLITALLLTEWRAHGTVDLRAFWARRARRLLPALLVLMVAVAGLAPLLTSAASRGRLRGDGLATLFYVANWRFVFSGHSYFDQFAAPSPLRHAWSLGVEEQWYLAWPLLVAGGLRLVKGRSRALLVATVVLGAGSALLMAWLTHPSGDPSRVYYGTDTRAQALLAGAALALALGTRHLGGAARAAVATMGVIGAVVLAGLVVRTSDADRWLYHGGYALVAVATVSVIAAAVQPGPNPVRSPLSLAPLRAVGRISYGLYLWHWPLYLVLTPARTGLDGVPLLALRLAVTLAVAVLSWHLVESPLRRGAWPRWPVPGPAFAAGALALTTGVFVFATPTVVSPPNPLASPTAVTPDAATAPTGAGGTGPMAPGSATTPAAPPLVTPRARDLRILVVGDSVALSLGYYFDPGLVGGATAKTKAVLGCGVVDGITLYGGRSFPSRPECQTWPTEWHEGVTTFRPNLAVVVVGAWEVFDREVDGRLLKVGTPEWRSYLAGQLDQGLRILTSGGARVALLTVPCFAQPRLGIGDGSGERDDQARVAAVNGVLSELGARHPQQVAMVDLGAFVCPDGHAVDQLNGVKLRSDGVHFTAGGARLAWQWLGPELAKVAAAPVAPG